MDIYQRCCLKDGLIFDDLKEDEVEILDTESAEEIMPEEEAFEDEEEKIDVKAVQTELESMKRRIQKLQLKLKMMHMSDHPDDECIDYEIELTCSRNKEICALQKAHHKLQCQIKQHTTALQVAKEMIEDLRIRMCEKSQEVLLLQKLVSDLCVWRDTLAHEFGVCLERFEYIKHVKAEWSDVEKKLESQRACFQLLSQKFVHKRCFAEEKLQLSTELSELKELIGQFLDLQSEKFKLLEGRVNVLVLMQPPIKGTDVTKGNDELPKNN